MYETQECAFLDTNMIGFQYTIAMLCAMFHLIYLHHGNTKIFGNLLLYDLRSYMYGLCIDSKEIVYL